LLTRLITYGVVLTMALLFSAGTASGHPLVECSIHQTPQKQINCGELNVWHGTTSLKFLHRHPHVGTAKSRSSLARGSAFLIRYGNRHTETGLRRQLYSTMPYVDSCLQAIITREASGFRYSDPSTWFRAALVWNGGGSGAYGIPQALPGSKMASAGSDWRTNPATQVRWMIGYVNGRYGGSCAALAYWNSAGSY
jgi:hypothetical protein